jgi:hypothetical protein
MARRLLFAARPSSPLDPASVDLGRRSTMQPGRSVSMMRLGIVVLALGAASPAWCVKWTTKCPSPTEKLVRGGKTGLVASMFVDPGHEMGIFLKDQDVTRSGGFSTEPDGNTIEIAFAPFDADPIPLQTFTATAVSPSALYFTFPDPQVLLGRIVAGPATINVWRGDVLVADLYRYPVVLPPFNDVARLVEQGTDADVLAVMDARGDLWVPFHFGGFGTQTPPTCPATMTPVVALAVDFSLRRRDGVAIPHAKFTKLKKGRLYLGDFVLDGINLYGKQVAKSLDVRRLHNKAITLCGINDSLALVMWLPLKNSSTKPGSDIIPLVRDGSPFVVKLRDIAADPGVAHDLNGVTRDSFGTPCAAAP